MTSDNQDTALEVRQEPVSTATVLQTIGRMAADPTIPLDRMQALLDMQLLLEQRRSELEFNRAMKAVQDEMEPVVRRARNEKGNLYAKLEHVDKEIRPVYTKHGFSLSFGSAEPRVKDNLRMLCDVRHIEGYTKTYELEGGLDISGPKGGSNKTSIQGLGSSASYLRRYLTIMIFNVILIDEDNDGQKTGTVKYISDDQKNTLLDLLIACKLPDNDKKFLDFAQADKLEHILAQKFETVRDMLKKKLANVERGGR